MRTLIVTEFLSLDGVMENPAWTAPYWNEETSAFKAEETSAKEALLLGRVTYEGFASAWPGRSDPGADYFNGTRKYVASTTLNTLEWNNSELLKGDVVQAVTQLKAQDGEDLVVHGSGKLAQTLMQHDLVDRYRFLVYPLVLGKGQRLFEGGIPLTLKLVKSEAYTTGVVALVYEPERKASS